MNPFSENQRDLLIPEAKIDDVFNLPAPYEVRGGVRYLSGTNKIEQFVEQP
jgi:hypothetical protein